jgi:hypothetical protein
MLDLLDPDRKVLPEEVQEQIKQFTGDADIANLLHASLGDAVNPNLEMAHDIFAPLMREGFVIPSIIMALNFYTISQTMRCIEESKGILAQPKIKNSDKNDAIQTHLDATKALSGMCRQLAAMAKMLGGVRTAPPGRKVGFKMPAKTSGQRAVLDASKFKQVEI